MAKKRTNGEGSIYQRQDGRWEARGYVTVTGGIRKRKSFIDHTRQGAVDKLQAALNKERQHIPHSDQAHTVASWLDYWMHEIMPTRIRPRTLLNYQSVIDCHIRPRIGNKSLEKLSVPEVQQAIDAMVHDGHSPRTVKKFRQVLSSALSHAMRRELIFRNVAKAVELPTYRRQPIQPWTAEQAQHFLAETADHRWHLAYCLMLLYGMRLGEVVGLRWKDIDFYKGEIHVRQQIHHLHAEYVASEVKTEAGVRVLPLIQPIRAAMRRIAGDLSTVPAFQPGEVEMSTTGTVLSSRFGGPLDTGAFRDTTMRLMDEASLPKIKLHHMRHTTATLLAALKVPPREVQLILGHSNISTTQQLYTHANMDVRREALEKIGALLSAPETSQLQQPDQASEAGTPGRARTYDLEVRTLPLYPTELPRHTAHYSISGRRKSNISDVDKSVHIAAQRLGKAAIGAGWRQRLASKPVAPSDAEVVKLSRSAEITGVRARENQPTQGRNEEDPLQLRSLFKASGDELLTPVISALHSATLRRLAAAVGVKIVVKNSAHRIEGQDTLFLDQRAERHLQILAEIRAQRQMQRLKNLSFPYNLVTRQEESWKI